MNIEMLKTKIHRATVTDTDLNYEGSISLPKTLCKKANLLEFEKVDVYNCNNGARLSTYVIHGPENHICLNGAGARLACAGDKIIIASYASFTKDEAAKFKPTIVLMDDKNRPSVKK